MIDLTKLKTPELVAEYNKYVERPVTKWKGKVSDLRARLLRLAPSAYTVTPSESDFEAADSELKAQQGRPVDHAEEPKPTKAKRSAKSKAADDRGAIRAFVEAELLKTKGTDEKSRRPLGLPYSDILAAVKRKFPEAETSVNCLRWYATKLNKRTGKERVVMPLRPKSAAA